MTGDFFPELPIFKGMSEAQLDLLRPLIKAGLVKRVGTKKEGRYILA